MKIKKNFKNNFTVIGNQYFQKLSMKALALYLYLLSKPDDWHFSRKGTARDTGWGETEVSTAGKELERKGLLVRIKSRTQLGQWDWSYELNSEISLDNPTVDEPVLENPTVVESTLGNPTIYKEKKNKELTTKKDYFNYIYNISAFFAKNPDEKEKHLESFLKKYPNSGSEAFNWCIERLDSWLIGNKKKTVKNINSCITAWVYGEWLVFKAKRNNAILSEVRLATQKIQLHQTMQKHQQRDENYNKI